MRRPQRVAMRSCSAIGAGIDDAPGSVMPSVSAIDAIVDAVPIVMQWPAERATPSSTPRMSSPQAVPPR